MKVLMLGWEYPPHISGGLGTACEGLSRALSRQGVNIDFVVPHLFGGEDAPHMRLMDPSKVSGRVEAPMHKSVSEVWVEGQNPLLGDEPGAVSARAALLAEMGISGKPGEQGAAGVKDPNINVIKIPSFLSPYLNAASFKRKRRGLFGKGGLGLEDEAFLLQLETLDEILPPLIRSLLPESVSAGGGAEHYTGDLFQEVGRFAARALGLIKNRDYDVIHAHDWMTFPAAVALKALTGLPLVLHVHSLEYDRCGGNGNWQIEQIEKAGLDAADQVIAVSYYTRSLIHQRHGVPLGKIGVVHNGVYAREMVSRYRQEQAWPSKIVLFLGRVTFQKGPDYFVEAAARVIPHVPDVLFVMAGSGDMLPRMVERVNELGISNNFLFTGFLKGQEVEKMFSMADLYVMPSVSEPFGISALEAISFQSPVIISRQSGVSEVLSHALKVNFWDVDQLANLIVSVLKYPELGQDISLMAGEEVRRLRWDASAVKTIELYNQTLARISG
ncbi:MAG: hypothetical protein A2428_09695 [Bdellovibrionales bacterium RIFOXYC1_FULL_54_43]|nr:MAG: hypothetical protein A2428_09695 [Bdellovibrionales bacterium RIFOXYC1_FULL_54_43]OFZ79653.1 MAG: hypothetical protein A2603_07645 [Bdellovibrionales bacterium RIFOXYD1_FULL_55_31]